MYTYECVYIRIYIHIYIYIYIYIDMQSMSMRLVSPIVSLLKKMKSTLSQLGSFGGYVRNNIFSLCLSVYDFSRIRLHYGQPFSWASSDIVEASWTQWPSSELSLSSHIDLRDLGSENGVYRNSLAKMSLNDHHEFRSNSQIHFMSILKLNQLDFDSLANDPS